MSERHSINNYIITDEAVVNGKWRKIDCFTVRILQYRLLLQKPFFAYFFLFFLIFILWLQQPTLLIERQNSNMTPRLFGHFSMFGLVFFVLNSLGNCEKMESCKIRLRTASCSLLSSDLVRGLHARASVEQQSRETRETRAAALEASPVSRLQQCAWSGAHQFSCVAPFARRTEKKERLLVVYEKLAILSLSLGVILEFYYIKRGLSAILKLRVRLAPPYVELHHGIVLERLSLLLLAGSEFTSPSPAPFPPLPESHGAIRHNKAKD